MHTPKTHIHDCSVFWLGTGTSRKSGRVTLVPPHPPLSEIMWSYKCLLRVSKILILTHNRLMSRYTWVSYHFNFIFKLKIKLNKECLKDSKTVRELTQNTYYSIISLNCHHLSSQMLAL
jgi:hypothetical protein